MLTAIRREPGLYQSPQKSDQTDREIGHQAAQSIRVPNPISKTGSGSSQRADGEQCAPVLAKVRHGLTTANLRSPTSTDDEGKINSPSKS
jgi:hypothetical protein